MTSTTTPTPLADAFADVFASVQADSALPATPQHPDSLPPAAGGSYTRDPITGALTLVTPSTIQE